METNYNESIMTNLARKLYLILWKNAIVRMQHKKLTFFQLCLPFLIMGFGILKSNIPDIHADHFDNDTYNDETNLASNNIYLSVYYAPNTGIVNDFMAHVVNISNIPVCRGFESETELISYLTDLKTNGSYNAFSSVAVIFNDFEQANPKNLNYTLRTEMNLNVEELYSLYPYTDKGKLTYLGSNFLYMQHIIDFNHIKMFGRGSISDIFTQEMPFPPHVVPNSIADALNIPTVIIIGIIFTLLSVDIVKRTLEEKVSGIKELMKIVGMEAWMLWLGWFIYIFVVSLIALLITSMFMTIDLGSSVALIKHLDFFLLYIYLILCICSTICFSFVICAVFTNVNFGATATFISWYVIYGLSSYVTQQKESVPYSLKYLLLMFPATGLCFGMDFIMDYEKYEKDLGWSEIYRPMVMTSPMPPLGAVMLMMLANSIFYMMLAWYLDLVFPGEFGIGQPYNFPFTKAFWITPREDRTSIRLEKIIERPEVEKAPGSLRAGIQIRKLEKNFTNKKAVDDLNIDIYHNELTVLLGHNGAGKTTTINIITGMTSPTSGKVLIDGYNIKSDIKKIRESLGFCPQHNIHFPDLTVIQHMKFFAMLKGMTQDEAILESKKFLSRLNIADKENKLASTLSGGQKRRLSLGMALVGAPQVLMLDEPTSGLDPEARREIWDFLLSMRGEHTILITTHYMEEADVLGDRIAIMHQGSLQCYGTSLFLKKFYGTGYVMNVLINSDADLNAMTSLIREYVPNANTKFVSTMYVTYDLPSSNTSDLTKLFIQLEQKKRELGIDSFGVSLTTLEDVFLKVGVLATNTSTDKQKHVDELHIELLQDNSSSSSRVLDYYNGNNTVFSNLFQVCWALLVKRLRYIQHTYMKFLVSIIIPILVVLLFCFIPTNVGNPKDIYRDITLSMYPHSDVYFSNQLPNSNISNYYSKLVTKQGGKPIETESVSKAILSIGHSNQDEYFHKLVVAAEFNISSTTAMFGNMPLHGPAISLNLISNALLQTIMDDDSYSISVTNKPMSIQTEDQSMIGSIGSMVTWAIILPSIFVSMHSSWINYPQEEHLCGVKHLQIMAGVPSFVYWFVCYIFDLILHVIYCVFSALLMYNVIANPIFTWPAMNVFLLLCVMYGLCAFPMMYVFTRLKSNTTTLNVLLALNVITGLFGTIATFLLDLAKYEVLSKGFGIVLSFSPFYTLTDGMRRWFQQSFSIYSWVSLTKENQEKQCLWDHKFECCQPDSVECERYLSYYTSETGLESTLLWMLAQIFLYWFILMMFEAGYPQMIIDRLFEKRTHNEVVTDEDVEEEKARVEIQNIDNSREMLLVKHLRKWYRSLYAVRNLSFGVQKGECFGLLGVNGAGKTTTFKMLTNEIKPSTGEVFIKNLELPSYSYLKQIGYCPQIDAINLSLTGREMLTFFAHIRGIPYSQISSEVEKWIKKLGIEQYADKLSRTYSGGNKRKLNTAIALIGEPLLVMLDEPTSGVDPASRRKIWDILSEMRKTGQSIVLTSHSMEECEALCDRLTIMVNGQMHCIGPIPHLKKKYGKGFTIMLKLSASDRKGTDEVDHVAGMTVRLKNIVENQYVCELKDEHHSMLLYHIGNQDASLGSIFQFMENLKMSNPDILEDFVVSDTSLEQVFLSFAKKRDEQTAVPNTSRTQVSPVSIV